MEKLDRTSWIGILVCILGLVGWQWYMNKYHPPRPVTPPALTADASPTPPPAPAAPTPAPTASPAYIPPQLSARTETVGTPSAEYVFSNDSGGIGEVVLVTHFGEQKEGIRLNADAKFPIGAIGFVEGELLGGFEMSVSATKGETLFHQTLPDGMDVTKRFVLPSGGVSPADYTVGLEVTLRNTGDAPISRPSLFVSTGSAAPVHSTDMPMYTRFDWFHGGKMEMIDVNWFSAGTIPLTGIQISAAKPLYSKTAEKVGWAGVSSQYFCILLNDPSLAASGAWARRFDITRRDGKHVFGIEGALAFPGFTLAPGESKTLKLSIFAGPKQYSILKDLGGGQQEAMNFGLFTPVSVALLWAMNTLHGYLGNYAWAIIVLTLIIKSALWPLQNAATQSMKKMSVLSPKMTELREKYKDDPQKMNEELMKLYKEYGVNPFGGCLPMLVQIPIFFGFYSMLGTSIELRNSSFLWVQDLSQPDTVFHLLGFPVNILPLVMAGTMVWQMAISPKTGDAMQQRIMMFMPVIFIAFAYNFASALSLYWTTQNLFSIVQLYLTRDKVVPALEKKSDVARREAVATKKKKKGRRPA